MGSAPGSAPNGDSEKPGDEDVVDVDFEDLE
jgi:hypothetical protein